MMMMMMKEVLFYVHREVYIEEEQHTMWLNLIVLKVTIYTLKHW